MTTAQEYDPQNTPEMIAWREKIRKDLAAIGVSVKKDFKMEPTKPAKAYGFPSINHDPRKDSERPSSIRESINSDSISNYRGRPARRNGQKPKDKAEIKPKQQEKLSSPITTTTNHRHSLPSDIVVSFPDQSTLITMIEQREATHKPLPKTLQDVYKDAVTSGNTTDGYLKMDLSSVRFPAEWRIPRENRSVLAMSDMRKFKERLETSISTMEASTSKKMYLKTIEAYKAKLKEFMRYY